MPGLARSVLTPLAMLPAVFASVLDKSPVNKQARAADKSAGS
jgi:hypothetical protein